ncbi:MAG: GNAT family N-acetyltransferase [Candidatus Thorarchaeota archaeon]|jgi:GNAT superfamily N-acetyltransferase
MVRNRHLIEHLEFVSAEAWPAEESENLDGWTLRATKGITWRANSVLPHSQLEDAPVEDVIDAAISFYTKRNILPAFKLTNCCFPKNLDEVLEERGFNKEMETFVQTAPISVRPFTSKQYSVRISPEPDHDWIYSYKKLGQFDDFTLKQRVGIINRIRSRKAFAKVRAGGETVGIGMGVLDYAMLGLFGIVTNPKHRGLGIAMSINAALLEWGRLYGANISYLQVEKKNTPAISLYEKCGFNTVYDYWYRILRN